MTTETETRLLREALRDETRKREHAEEAAIVQRSTITLLSHHASRLAGALGGMLAANEELLERHGVGVDTRPHREDLSAYLALGAP